MNLHWLGDIDDLIQAWLADLSLDGLLTLMDMAIYLSRLTHFKGDYYRNLEYVDYVNNQKIHYFNCRYLFEAKDGARCGAVFAGGDMKVFRQGISKWDVKIAFKDDAALLKYLLKGITFHGIKIDAEQALLDNEVQVYGNVNYLFKFGHMTKDLLDRFGLLA